MKVRIVLTLNIDPEAWATEYGLEKSEVRDDVRLWVQGEVMEGLNDRGMLLKEGS